MKNWLAIGCCLLSSVVATGCAMPSRARIWALENLGSVGGGPTEVLGAPRVRVHAGRKAICFDGRDDGLLVASNPIAGLDQFTIEVLFMPEGDGPAEQRFLHIQDEEERRVLIETRVTGQGNWSLDTFLRATDADKLTLLDRERVQATDRWYWAALVYDGVTMAHYVDGVRQLTGAVKFPAMGAGRTSLGVRQNRVHWFKGCIAEVRFSGRALPPGMLQKPAR